MHAGETVEPVPTDPASTRAHTAPPSLSLGTWALAGAGPWGYGPCAPDLARRTVQAAFDAGCRRFDTASAFGNGAVERLLAEALAGQSDVAVTTRVGVVSNARHPVADFSATAITRMLAQAAQRLQPLSLDRVLLHRPSIRVLRDGAAMAVLRDARDRGSVTAIGATVGSIEEAEWALASGADWLCLPYHPADRRVEAWRAAGGGAGTALQVREVLHNGLFTDAPRDPSTYTRFDVRREWGHPIRDRVQNVARRIRDAVPDGPLERTCVAYALAGPGVQEVVVGCRTPAQVMAVFGEPSGKSGPPTPLSSRLRARIHHVLYGDSEGVGGNRLLMVPQAASMASISSSDRP